MPTVMPVDLSSCQRHHGEGQVPSQGRRAWVVVSGSVGTTHFQDFLIQPCKPPLASPLSRRKKRPGGMAFHRSKSTTASHAARRRQCGKASTASNAFACSTVAWCAADAGTMQRIGSSIAYHEASSVRMSRLPKVHPIGIRVRSRALRASQGAALTHLVERDRPEPWDGYSVVRTSNGHPRHQNGQRG